MKYGVALATGALVLVAFACYEWRWHVNELQDLAQKLADAPGAAGGVVVQQQQQQSLLVPQSSSKRDFPLVVEIPNISCEESHQHLGINVIYDEPYLDDFKAFVAEFQRVMAMTKTSLEGHTGQNPTSMLLLRAAVNKPWIKDVCEIGFNAGHSTFNWLTSNRNVKVWSFDIGHHPYSKPISQFLRNRFPGRLVNTWGDSTRSVPAFIQANPDVKCDLLFVDGGHTYPVAKADLANFKRMARPKNIVVLDDYPTKWGMNFGRSWEEFRKQNVIKETFRCGARFKDVDSRVPPERGLTFGYYVQ